MNIRSYKTELILAAISIFVISSMVLFNDINRQIRIRELRIFLQKSAREDNSLDHIGLVMKYRLQKKMYENQISQDEADIIEMRVNSMLAEMTAMRSVRMDRYEYLSVPALVMINLFRSIINKGPIQDLRVDNANIFLEIAYYYERNNYFAKALEIYAKALKEERYDKGRIASILLHQGYCNAILGNYELAKKYYNTIIADYSDRPVATTALILLRYIEGFKSELDRVLKNERDTVNKSEKLIRLIAYREAVKVLDKVDKTAAPGDKSKILYLKGRCLEGLSQKEKAIDTYQKIVLTDTRSNYAKLANRRIYISSSLARKGDKLKDLAVQNNTVLKDVVFDKMIKEETKVRRNDGIDEERDRSTNLERELVEFESNNPVLNIGKIESYKETAKSLSKIMDQERRQKKTYQKRQEQIKGINVTIQTNEGNIFIGNIVEETGKHVVIKSIIGSIKIPKNKIVSRTPAEQAP